MKLALPYSDEKLFGIMLSGGQRQRLAIARMLLGEYDIILLDESTSALDGDNERRVLELIKEKMRDKIVFFISHRESTVRYADKIIYFDAGKVSDICDYEMLMERTI